MEQKKKSSKKLIWQLVYIFGTLILIYLLGFADPEFQKIGDRIQQFHMGWLAMGLAGVLGFWLIQGGVLKYCTHFMGDKVSYWRNLKVTIIGEYYSAITPFSTGGQPMQMAYYKRYGIGLAKSSCLLSIRFIGYISSLCMFYIFMMIFNGSALYEQYTAVFWLTTLGFVFNIGSVIFIIVLLINKNLVLRIGNWVIRFLVRFKLFRKKEEAMRNKFTKGVDDFSAAGQYLRHHAVKCALVILLSILSIMCLYSVSYFIYRAMGFHEYGYLDLFTMQTFLYLAVAFVPTPGAIGASEGGFYLFFGVFFPQNLLYLAMFLWRLFTYYLNLIAGAVIIIWDELVCLIRRKRRGEENVQSTVFEEVEGGEEPKK